MKQYLSQITTADGVNILDAGPEFFLTDKGDVVQTREVQIAAYEQGEHGRFALMFRVKVGGQYQPNEEISFAAGQAVKLRSVFTTKAAAYSALAELHMQKAIELSKKAGGAA